MVKKRKDSLKQLNQAVISKNKARRVFAAEIKKNSNKSSASKILDKYKICNNCLGRQFGRLSTGMTNKQRGEIIRKELKSEDNTKKCEICSGLFQGKLEKLAGKAIKKLDRIQYRTFVVGSRISKELISNEEKIWEHSGFMHAEQLKTEMNREIGKIISKKTRKEVDELQPDVVVLFDMNKNLIEIQVNPFFIYGKYQKLVRGIPQTKWEMYKTSVEDIIAKPIMKATKGKAHAMHGAGREDIDAKCLGWRPFIIEITEPIKRRVGLGEIQSSVNKSKKVQVKDLRLSDKKEVAVIKAARNDKTYRMLVQFQKNIDNDKLPELKVLVGKVKQKTPERVLHRRSDLMRLRNVRNIRWKTVTNKKLELEIKGEAGLYVKELVSGDNGRTTPSVAETLGNPAKVIELDVIKIHDIKKKR